MGDGTAGMALITPITDIRSPVKPLASFFHKILTMLVAGRTRGTLDTAGNYLSTDILLLAVKAVDAKVFSVQEEPRFG